MAAVRVERTSEIERLFCQHLPSSLGIGKSVEVADERDAEPALVAEFREWFRVHRAPANPVTGMRVSEALNLVISDVTADGLLIRKTKFQKTRLVPLHDTTSAGLRSYLAQRLTTPPAGDLIFVGRGGRPLTYRAVYPVFRTLLEAAGVQASHRHRTRLHELRHTFAVRALESAPGGRQQIAQHLLALATYLGHVNIGATYWYLETTPELLADIAAAGDGFLVGGRP
jgi:integrase/recombinase XerD